MPLFPAHLATPFSGYIWVTGLADNPIDRGGDDSSDAEIYVVLPLQSSYEWSARSFALKLKSRKIESVKI
jgi:hypothetical protein